MANQHKESSEPLVEDSARILSSTLSSVRQGASTRRLTLPALIRLVEMIEGWRRTATEGRRADDASEGAGQRVEHGGECPDAVLGQPPRFPESAGGSTSRSDGSPSLSDHTGERAQ